MSHPEEKSSKGPIDRKVNMARAAALAIAAIVTVVATWAFAFRAKHTTRNDSETRSTNTSDQIPPTD